jgi:hypothetical protein
MNTVDRLTGQYPEIARRLAASTKAERILLRRNLIEFAITLSSLDAGDFAMSTALIWLRQFMSCLRLWTNASLWLLDSGRLDRSKVTSCSGS